MDPSRWHGYLLADACLPLAACVVASDALARPTFTKTKSAEYIDFPEVLEMKADVLIRMWLAAKCPLVYTGAGISTSAGIRDYASNATRSVVQAPKAKRSMGSILALQPTPAHRVLTAMEKAGLVYGWLQQNHDGLAQKAGFPADKVNEVHGSWLDSRANPIIVMSGTLRSDLFRWMVTMEKQCDFVFAAGTSFSGLNADRCAATCAARHMDTHQGQGVAIISVQQTPMDGVAALRVFARIDEFMLIVARKLQLRLDVKVHQYSAAALPVGGLTAEEFALERLTKLEEYQRGRERRAAAAKLAKQAKQQG